MKKLDTRARVLLMAVLPAAAIALLLAVFFVVARFDDLEQALRDQERVRARQIATASEYGVFSGNLQSLQFLADSAMSEGNVLGLLIIGPGGHVLAQAGKHTQLLSMLPLTQGRGEFFQEWNEMVVYCTPIRVPDVALDDVSTEETRKPEVERGRVILAVDRSILIKKKIALFSTGVGIPFAVLALVLLASVYFSRRVSKPMEELEAAVEQIGQGNFEVRVNASEDGGIARLAASVNRMAAELAASHQNLNARVQEATEELRLRKEEAEQANVAKSRFLAAASHDLRQPMHALGLFVGQLQQQDSSPESQRLIGQISESVRALGSLLDGLLDISKLDAGVLHPDPTQFALMPLFARLENDFTSAAEAKGLLLRVRATQHWVNTDPVLLERILLNLLSNAVRYTRHGSILLACRRRGERVRIEVRDSGIGIPAESQDVVFNEFVQLSNPGRNRSQGLGLGLAIVRRLVGLLNLRLELRSQPEQGSVFAVEVPVARPVVGRPLDDNLVGQSTHFLEGKVILVVDDDDLVLQSVQGLLESWGCVVLPAMSGAQALDRIRRMGVPPDAVLCDYRLADNEKGTDVLRALHTEFDDKLPAILISGDTDPSVLRAAKEEGVSLLSKPLSSGKLRTLLHRLLSKTRH